MVFSRFERGLEKRLRLLKEGGRAEVEFAIKGILEFRG